MNPDELIKAVNDVKQEIKELKNDNVMMARSISETIIANITQKLDGILTKHQQLHDNQVHLEKRIDNIEREIRRRNIIIHGLRENENNHDELEQFVVDTLNNICVLNVGDLDFIRRIGAKSADRTRPIVVGLTTWRKKLAILQNKNKITSKTFYITEDFPPKVLQIRKELRAQQIDEQNNGNYAVIRYDKLIVKKGYSADDTIKSNDLKRLQSTSPVMEPQSHQSQQSPRKTAGRSRTVSASTLKRRRASSYVISSNSVNKFNKNNKISYYFAGRGQGSNLSDSELASSLQELEH